MAAKTKAVTTRYVTVVKNKRHHSNGKTIPLALIAGFAPLASQVYTGAFGGTGLGWGLQGALKEFTFSTTGYFMDDGKFYWHGLKRGMLPIAIGMIVHWGAKRLGVNRALGRAGVPLLRV